MAGHDLDYQISGPSLRLVPGSASDRRPRTGGAALYAARAGSPDWMSRAACRGEDPELFFPIPAAGPAPAQIRAAKAVCDGCPVQAICLCYAVVTSQDGIWGGTTREERLGGPVVRSALPCPPAVSAQHGLLIRRHLRTGLFIETS